MLRSVFIAAALLGVAALETTENPIKAVAMGNLAVLYRLESLVSTDDEPLTAKTTGPLWCQATLLTVPQPARNSTFFRYSGDHSNKRRRLTPNLNQTTMKASLDIGEKVIENMGKYRCEITMEETGAIVFGNLMVYSRPFFHSNGSIALKQENLKENLVTGSTQYATEAALFHLHCPAVGYPTPNITWFKDTELLEESERVRLNGTSLFIENFAPADEGLYRCTATATFPTNLDKDDRTYEASLEMPVKIGSKYSWLLPLAVILVILCLLFIIIYACSACKRYQHDNYNVAKREKRLLRTPSPDSSAASTKKYELVSSA